jgi:hypothetical protein
MDLRKRGKGDESQNAVEERTALEANDREDVDWQVQVPPTNMDICRVRVSEPIPKRQVP